MKSGFSIEFSIVRSTNLVLTTLKSASFEIRNFIFLFILPISSFGRGKLVRKEF